MSSRFGFEKLNNRINPTIHAESLTKSLQMGDFSTQMVAARVTDIVLDNNHPKFRQVGEWNGIGTIEFQVIGTQVGFKDVNPTALPLIPYVRNFPLVDELVILFSLPDSNIGESSKNTSYYYLNPINVWNHPHHNAYPNPTRTEFNPEETKDYEAIEGGAVRRTTPYSDDQTIFLQGINPSGGEFEEQVNVHPLLPFIGDIIYEGRFGNSIRFGSTVNSQGGPNYRNNWSQTGPNNSPITILRNGQPTNVSDQGWIPLVENINKDLSSIYLTSNQKVPLQTGWNSEVIGQLFRQPPEEPSLYSGGSQVMLNSGRLVFNTTEDSIILSSKKSVVMAASDEIGILSNNQISLLSGKVNLGGADADEALIKGDSFMIQFETLLKQLINLCTALESSQIYPGGVPAPDPVIPLIASSTKQTITGFLNTVKNPKKPLLSSVSRTK
tara:strand:+ start:101 stop:1420 length:1320 start_codon:yes stop_codon:yes gene_type:complete